MNKTKKNFIIRMARPEDAVDIGRIRAAGWRYSYAGIMPDDMIERKTEITAEWVAGMEKRISDVADGSFLLVALDGGKIVGFAAGSKNQFEKYSNADMTLSGLYVYPEYVGTGLGKLLFNAIVKKFSELGAKSVNVGCLTKNKSCGFYAHMGAGGRYLCKVFAKYRTPADIARYIGVMEKVTGAGIAIPEMHRTNDGLLFQDSGLSMVLMDYIDGKTFYELGRAPDDKELDFILGQAAKINKLKFDHLSDAEDSVRIDNICTLYDSVAPFISDSRELKEITSIVSRYKQIPFDELPISFVHADIIGTNVIKSNEGKIYIIDFGVAGMYRRIIELAVIVGRMMIANGRGVKANTNKVAEMYQKYASLSGTEVSALPTYAQASIGAMYLWAYRGKFINKNDSKETSFWLNLCRREINAG
ncbi:MAG: GNAT family N-acetyltransferase [Proteobacteria bacterium]|nr:GNAT family N-acetyltransferase [Pseudomonadota bacterium]